MTTIAFYTLGCRSNQYETDAMRSQCLAMEIVPFEERADIYVINTCTVTSDADKKSRQAIRKALKQNPSAQVLAVGCYTELQKSFLEKGFPEIRILANRQKKDFLKSLPPQNAVSQCHLKEARVRANLMVEDGCENYCAYCIVPYARGKIINRPMQEAVAEAEKMVEDGTREIILTGINLGEYKELVPLIKKLGDLDQLYRVRLSSIEPMYVTDELIDLVATNAKLCRHLHIPLQTGDDKLLALMQRKYTADDFRRITDSIREKVTNCAITTDIIVGLPGEGEKEFENTLKLVEELQFSRLHLFTYSKRPGTAAANMPGQVDPRIIKERYDILNDLRSRLMKKFAEKYLGKQVEVLVEQAGEGLTDNYIRVLFDPSYPLGKLISIKYSG